MGFLFVVAVIAADATMCRSNNLVKVLPVSGFLSNLVPSSSPGGVTCSGDSSPHWLIEAQPGQRINVTLWDFGLRSPTNHRSPLSHGCIKYATLTEVGPEVASGPARVKTVCGGVNGGPGSSVRIRQVYMSIGSAIEVDMNVMAVDGSKYDDAIGGTPAFLIQYHSQYNKKGFF